VPTSVIAYVPPVDTAARQQRAILEFARTHDLYIQVISSNPQACAQAVAGGLARVVLAAADPRNGLRNLVTAAGGSMRFVREPRERLTVAGLFRRLAGRGQSPHDIAEMHGLDTVDVREILRRSQPPS
jgi:hypothetical protein